MQSYEATVSYKLIYVFTIPDTKHEGCLKIGETGLDSPLSYKQLPPNCEELNQAARDRIDQYTKTALIDYGLLHTELARRYVRLADGTEDWTLFSDNDVHNVLYASGYAALKFASIIYADNLLAYLKTKFVRFLTLQVAISQHLRKACFKFVPVQDFSKPWTDAELYEKYGLTADEIAFIEAMIKPME